MSSRRSSFSFSALQARQKGSSRQAPFLPQSCFWPGGIQRGASAERRIWEPVRKTQCKCTCRRGSGPSAPARARFMGLIGCTRVLCRAVSCSSGMPDDSFEANLSARVASAAKLLAANRSAGRGASSASVLHCAPALRGLPLRLPGPCWPSAQPRTCRQEVLCALVPI